MPQRSALTRDDDDKKEEAKEEDDDKKERKEVWLSCLRCQAKLSGLPGRAV